MSSLLSQHLNEKLRDALLAFYLYTFNPLKTDKVGIESALRSTPDDLYSYWLLDVQVSQAVMTSRVFSAISSLQQYINNIALGFEPGYEHVGMNDAQTSLWDNSLHSYSLWHAHQQLRHYPANYISPHLRIDKTDSFQQLESDISQTNLQPGHIDAALNRYLGRFEELAQIRTVNGYVDGDASSMAKSRYYLVGKSNGENAFYWRVLDLAKQYGAGSSDSTMDASSPTAWSDWRKLPIPASYDIPDQSIRPVYFHDRLFVVWAQCSQPLSALDGAGTPAEGLDIFNPEHMQHLIKRYPRLRLYYSFLKLDGSWSCPQICIDEYATSRWLQKLSTEDIKSTVSTVAMVDPHTSPPSLFFGLVANIEPYTDTFPLMKGKNFDFSHAVRLDSKLNVTLLLSKDSLNSFFSIAQGNAPTQASRHLNIFAGHNRYKFNFVAPSINAVDVEISNMDTLHAGSDRWDYQGTQGYIEEAKPGSAKFNKTTSSLELSTTTARNFPSFKSVELVVQQNGFWLFMRLTVEAPENTRSESIVLKSDSYLNMKHPRATRLLKDYSSIELTCNKTNTVFKDFLKTVTAVQNQEQPVVFQNFGQTQYSENYVLDGVSVSTELFNYLFHTQNTTYSAKLKVVDDSHTADPSVRRDELQLENIKATRFQRIYKQVVMTLLPPDKNEDVKYPLHVHITNTHLIGESHVMRRNLVGGKFELPAGRTFVTSLGITAEQLPDYISQKKKLPIIHGVLIREQNIDDMKFNILGYALKAFEIVFNDNNIADIPKGPCITRLSTAPAGTVEFIDFSDSSIAQLKSSPLTLRAPIRLNTTLGEKLTQAASTDMSALFALSHTHREPPLTSNAGPDPIDFQGAYGKYLWELFLYMPWLIAHRFNLEQRYGDAEAWLKYVFDPARKQSHVSLDQPYWGLSALNSDSVHMGYLHDNPDDPNQIALSAPVHFKRALYALYVDILLNRGDAAYRQTTSESLNQAKLWYVRAQSLLGPEPSVQVVDPWASTTLGDLSRQIDDSLRATERKMGRSDFEKLLSADHSKLARAIHRVSDSPLLCVPQDKGMLAHWEKVQSRLFNLRNHLDITGKPLRIPLYAPPASPRQLLNLYASPRMAGDASSVRRQPVHVGHYRFQTVHSLAMVAVENVVQFGNVLLSIIERQDQTEHLQLQQQQVWQLAGLSLEQQAQSRIIDEKNQEALKAGQRIVEGRIAHLEHLIKEGVNANEQQASQELQRSTALDTVAYGLQAAAGLAMLVPNIFGTSTGGWRLEGGFYATQAGIQMLANEKRSNANHLDRNEAFNRRNQEWEHALRQSRLELEQVKTQVLALREQANNTRLQHQSAETALSQARLMFDLLEKRFTTPQLYQWLSTQLSAFYLQAYDMALALCLDAQACWHYERADSDRTFVHASQWSSYRQGLTAGEGLKLSLMNMQVSYLQHNGRPMEITKTVSLRNLKAKDPDATRNTSWDEMSATLQRTGSVEFELTKALFDADYPDHYLRRIKSISVTLPATLGPYEDIRATLTQTNHTTHTADKGEFDYSSHRVNEHIALSTGLNDSGLFTLNFEGDDRYLPFEYTGAVSGWKLSFPNPAAQSAMLSSLSDIIIHVRYTAKQLGGHAG
ncbi:neuraminidase-like domain-containing protein [Pseudomonas lundensis]|uniref:Tc toxin subunit A-related protein n=1 Tax=Pseudomonas lundensis TaxID=86185 RepID=UPI0014743840|nr:neuraminidase-like domain-containing protein [Pseudomonas lundensis]NNA29357.1 phage tail tape measure protein [Pseudomonas lundensis]NNA38537.1 phage tail tape measure protein [Pseudomonas lundensis]